MNTRTGRWETVPVPAYVGALEPETGAVLSATPAAVDAEEEHKVLVMRASSGALVVLQDRAAETAEAREMLLGGEHHGRRARGRGAAETAEARARSRGHAQQGGAAGTRWDAAPGTEPHGLTLAWSMHSRGPRGAQVAAAPVAADGALADDGVFAPSLDGRLLRLRRDSGQTRNASRQKAEADVVSEAWVWDDLGSPPDEALSCGPVAVTGGGRVIALTRASALVVGGWAGNGEGWVWRLVASLKALDGPRAVSEGWASPLAGAKLVSGWAGEGVCREPGVCGGEVKEGGEGGGRGVRERGSACKRRRGFEGHDSALELEFLQQGLSVWPGADGRALPEASGKRKRVQSVDGAGVRHDEAAGGAGHSRSIPSGLSAGEGVEALVLPACVSGHVGCGSLGREREGQVRGRAGDSGHASKDTHADGRGTDVRVHSGGVCRVGALALVPSTRALWLLGKSGRVYETQTRARGREACWLVHPGPQVCSEGYCVKLVSRRRCQRVRW